MPMTLFIFYLNYVDISDYTFNTTCCMEKGVPKNCMGLCTLATSARWIFPPNNCEQFENTIQGCVIHGTYCFVFIII